MHNCLKTGQLLYKTTSSSTNNKNINETMASLLTIQLFSFEKNIVISEVIKSKPLKKENTLSLSFNLVYS